VREKPAKPKNCPLTPSGGGIWVKKINGKLYSFGPWHDLEGALKCYYSEVDFILADGYRREESDSEKLTVEQLSNLFLEFQNKRADLPRQDGDSITFRHYNDLQNTCKIFVRTVKKGKIAENLSPNDFFEVKSLLPDVRWKRRGALDNFGARKENKSVVQLGVRRISSFYESC